MKPDDKRPETNRKRRKLDTKQVRVIQQLFRDQPIAWPQAKLSRLFKMSPATICRIVNGRYIPSDSVDSIPCPALVCPTGKGNMQNAAQARAAERKAARLSERPSAQAVPGFPSRSPIPNR